MFREEFALAASRGCLAQHEQVLEPMRLHETIPAHARELS
jgi:hypothetical protein